MSCEIDTFGGSDGSIKNQMTTELNWESVDLGCGNFYMVGQKLKWGNKTGKIDRFRTAEKQENTVFFVDPELRLGNQRQLKCIPLHHWCDKAKAPRWMEAKK